MTDISRKAAQAIVYAINFHLEDAGLLEVRTARLMAIGLAATIRQIMLEEMNPNLSTEEIPAHSTYEDIYGKF